MELAYSGHHQLGAPMLDRLERLPVPQRDALTIGSRSEVLWAILSRGVGEPSVPRSWCTLAPAQA